MRDCSVVKSCPTLCDPMDCNLPGSSVRGVFQAILEGCSFLFQIIFYWPYETSCFFSFNYFIVFSLKFTYDFSDLCFFFRYIVIFNSFP